MQQTVQEKTRRREQCSNSARLAGACVEGVRWELRSDPKAAQGCCPSTPCPLPAGCGLPPSDCRQNSHVHAGPIVDNIHMCMQGYACSIMLSFCDFIVVVVCFRRWCALGCRGSFTIEYFYLVGWYTVVYYLLHFFKFISHCLICPSLPTCIMGECGGQEGRMW